MRSIRNLPVVVIGGAGFLGSHLVKHLIEDRGCDVLVLDNLISGTKKFLHEKAKFQWCDITHSEEQLKKIFLAHDARYVFNYAAEPYIPVSFDRPLHVFDINARGALMVLNAAHEAGVEAVLQVSSAEIYGDQKGKISEEAMPYPHSTYGASKLAIDMLVQSRWRESKTRAIALRQFNCVGERETHPYVIPEIISQLASGPKVLLGNNSYRDFQYAGDAVRNAVLLLENGKYGEVYNMGSEETIPVYDLVPMIADIMGVEGAYVAPDPARVRPWEIWHLQSDNTKLYGAIGAQEKTPLKEALTLTVLDYQKNGWVF